MKNEQPPRRIRLDLMSPAELAIYNAVCEVENVGADIRLTNAVILLQRARDSVADFIDNVNPNPQIFVPGLDKEKILEIIKECEDTHGRSVGPGWNYESYILPSSYGLLARKINQYLSADVKQSGGVIEKQIGEMKTAWTVVPELDGGQSVDSIRVAAAKDRRERDYWKGKYEELKNKQAND